MAEQKQTVTEQQKRSVIDQLWLHYYNQILHDKNMISDRDYSRMKAKINSRKPTFPECQNKYGGGA